MASRCKYTIKSILKCAAIYSSITGCYLKRCTASSSRCSIENIIFQVDILTIRYLIVIQCCCTDIVTCTILNVNGLRYYHRDRRITSFTSKCTIINIQKIST